MAPEPSELLATARAGSRAALARLLSLAERGGGPGREIARLTHPLAGSAYTVGLTGAPGAGKSTLTGRLVAELRGRAPAEPVAVLAVDPSSPFSGGAILGDRVRMQEHALDDGVFIRSMASRGHLGGLSVATPETVRVLDACGFPWILVETVGVGQVEVEVAGEADTTVVVVNPGWGDAVQAAKAGLLEIADVFVINKADRPGVEETQRDLEQMLELSGGGVRDPGAPAGGAPDDGWQPRIVRTVASAGEGVDDVVAAIEAHRQHLTASGQLAARRAQRLATELRSVVELWIAERVRKLCGGQAWEQATADVVARRVDPWSAAEDLIEAFEGARDDRAKRSGE